MTSEETKIDENEPSLEPSNFEDNEEPPDHLQRIGSNYSELPSDFRMKATNQDLFEEHETDQIHVDIPEFVDEDAPIGMPLQNEEETGKETSWTDSSDLDVKNRLPSTDRGSKITEGSSELIVSESVSTDSELKANIAQRKLYKERYDNILPVFTSIKVRNSYLHRRMSEYFKKRKMDHVFHEENYGDVSENDLRYHQALIHLGDLKDLEASQKLTTTRELTEQREQRTTYLHQVEEAFIQLQKRHLEIGTGLKFAKRKKELTEKEVMTMLTKHRRAAEKVTILRKKFVKERDRLLELTASLRSLETIGEGLLLMDYETMKMENQVFVDRIEERDEDLTRLRTRCNTATQTLAHMREKSASTTIVAAETESLLKEIFYDEVELRERLRMLKQARDEFREGAKRLQDECGLLTNQRMLLDMEASMELKERLQEEVVRAKGIFDRQKKQLAGIRARLEDVPTKAAVAAKKRKAGRDQRYSDRRPTLISPVMPKQLYGYFPAYRPE